MFDLYLHLSMGHKGYKVHRAGAPALRRDHGGILTKNKNKKWTALQALRLNIAILEDAPVLSIFGHLHPVASGVLHKRV